ncbi:hypothetical protein MMC25_000556 [Agyrium rufum]|nr:hypothetical protein [Agyrium rufum]
MAYARNGGNGLYSQEERKPPRRPGGYGGFYSNDPAEQEESDPPPIPEFAPQESPGLRGFQSRRGNPSPSRDGPLRQPHGVRQRQFGNGVGARQIEDVVQHIQESWSILAKPDCVPVHVALQLMDHSSLGRGNDYLDFKETSKELQKALKAIVNEHHQGFNSSIGTFHKIQTSIQTSQNRIRNLKLSLVDAKANLTTTKPELRGLSTSSQGYDDMLQILGQIEKIQVLPDQLDVRISDKHFLSAVDILQDALRLIRNSNLENIGSIADLRVYVNNQETSLTDILIEELHDHLYLKSPYCQNRWRAFTSSFQEAGDRDEAALQSAGVSALYQFLNGLDLNLPIADDLSGTPEANSFEYMHMLIEALNKMGHLDVAVERIEQRLPVELFAVVERTNQEVDLRHPSHLRDSQKIRLDGKMSRFQDTLMNQEVLDDLLWTLYSKFEAIAEGHRATHEIILGIVQREGFRQNKALLGSFRELWKLYQSEMRSILHDYLATDSDTLNRAGANSIANTRIFQKVQRDKNKKLFKLGEVDEGSAELIAEREELDKILQTSVPGLVSKSNRQSGKPKGDRPLTHDGSTTSSHKLLVEPSVFNISLLLPPSIFFLQKLRDIVPTESEIAISTLTSFLDDFLVNIFSPQLDETITELCTQTFMDVEAFQQDQHWADHSQRPIFKGAVLFFSSITAFCRMLDTIPEDPAFTQLILTQLATYHDKSFAWYTSLVSRTLSDGTSQMKAAALLMEGGDVLESLKALWSTEITATKKDDIADREVDRLIAITNEQPLMPYDIISDRRTVTSLCLLYSSMQWLASHLRQLQRKTTPTTTLDLPTGRNRSGNRDQHIHRWTMVSTASLQSVDQPAYLPMPSGSGSGNSTAIFEGILKALLALAEKALFTLHTDIRLGIVHMLNRVLSQSSYILDSPSNDPDPSVLQLNADLLSFDDTLSTYLPEREYQFVVNGLGRLMDQILVVNSPTQIKHGINAFGAGRMQLNVLVLQQNLKGLETRARLSKSAAFFGLLSDGPDGIINSWQDSGYGRDSSFAKEEAQGLLRLSFAEGMASSQREVAEKARRAFDEYMAGLEEPVPQNSGPTMEQAQDHEVVEEEEDQIMADDPPDDGDDFA